MAFEIVFEKSNKPVNWPLVIFGLIFLTIRLYLLNTFKIITSTGEPGYANEVMHTSYFISLCMCLAMILSFRVKLFNTMSIVLFLVCFFSFPTWDIPHWFSDPVGSMAWWNAITIHTPILIIAIYMVTARKVLISKESFFIGILTFAAWFFTVDDKKNGTVFEGSTYVLVAGIVLVVWTLLCWFTILKDCPKDADPFIAPNIRITGFIWKNKTTTVKESVIPNESSETATSQDSGQDQ
jgi:hypothetical protein